MVYGVLGDVHSNLEALRAVLAELERLGAEELLFLGDAVGYGADANGCLELLEQAGIRAIRGNHDRLVGSGGVIPPYDYSSDDVREADEWNRRVLTEVNLRRLRGFAAGPLAVRESVVICHGSPRDEDEYLVSWEEVERNARFLRAEFDGVSVCFFGHTHIAVAVRESRRALEGTWPAALPEGELCFINPGSVGQPRDGDPRASFGLYDARRRLYWNHRVGYDIGAARRKIAAAGLPRRFAERLRHGR